MSSNEFEFDQVDFVTVGTIGPPGQRVFHLQAKKDTQLLTLTLEKEQAAALAESIEALLEEIKERYDIDVPEVDTDEEDLDLEEPIIPTFRIAQLGLGYDNEDDKIVLVVNELLPSEAQQEPRVARISATREQMKMLADHTRDVVSRGRPSPSSNGYKMHH